MAAFSPAGGAWAATLDLGWSASYGVTMTRFLISCLCLAAHFPARAEVVRAQITGRSDVAGTGYEQIVGRLCFEIDPGHPRNRVIADVDLAPTNAAGRVTFSSDFRILKPKEAGRSNGAAWVEIPNRGGKCGLSRFVAQHGFTVMEVGWEFDVPARDGKMRIEVPVARGKDGQPIRGVVCATFTPDRPMGLFTVGDLADYPPADAGGPDSRLIVRAATAFPDGKELPRGQWSLEGQRVTLDGGFEVGKTYEIAYLAENPPVAGLGLAAIRDAVVWLKHDAGSLAPVRRAYAFGSSQCGRLLREFIYLGFNTDERDRLVLDGVMAHVAGAGRLDINRRWSVPRGVAAFQTASYPFTDTAQADPVSGISEGIQENPRVTQRPKIFYMNTAAEYWGAGRVAGLSHTSADGTRDVPLPDNVRSYFFAGTQHGAATFPPKAPAKDAQSANPVNASPVVLALRLAMHRWVSQGTPPPPSAYPRLSDGTLIPVSKVCFPGLPGITSPRGVRAGARLRNPLWPNGAGAGTELPLLVPQVDADGNDIAGIRMPDVSVPLATCTGWMFRPASMGCPEELLPLKGSWIPFATTREQRERLGDPRPAIKERYPTREIYLSRVGEALQELLKQGFLLAEDIDPMLKQAGDHWDWAMSRQNL
ncbi:MAG TPA: alpha/beta hydrolase domain-containing protein [Verrucomicrobiae bacterium]|nr:alpha/beta hydrolase domain-containing protein [Verrucomicrobiae bacterium]